MSLSENILPWKERSEIDYVPLFISLWLAFNVWMKDRWKSDDATADDRDTDRNIINFIKRMDPESLKGQFIDFIDEKDPETLTFKGYFAELHRALEDAKLEYGSQADGFKDDDSKVISFSNCIIEWKKGNFQLESVVKAKKDNVVEDDIAEDDIVEDDIVEDAEIKIDSQFFVENDPDRLFAAYIEILYQVRHLLLHGNLLLIPKNERVIKYLYLTLSMITKSLGKE